MSCLSWLIPLILIVGFLAWNMFLHINKTVRLDTLERQLDTEHHNRELEKAARERLERALKTVEEILSRVLTVDVATRWEIYNPKTWGQGGMPYIIMEKKASPATPIPVKKEKTK